MGTSVIWVFVDCLHSEIMIHAPVSNFVTSRYCTMLHALGAIWENKMNTSEVQEVTSGWECR
jgi:hypothetical protein